jgi:hypothetical protein
MTTSKAMPRRFLAGLGLLMLAACFSAAPAACARTITLGLEFARLQFSTLSPGYSGNTYYTVNVQVASDVPAVTYDEVDSPEYPDSTNAAFSGTETGYGEYYFGDLASALNQATNGVWTLIVNKGDVSQTQYTFTVSVNGLSSTDYPAILITTPADGSPAVSTNTSFSWSGPASWNELGLVDHSVDYSFYISDSPPPATTNWAPGTGLPLGTNDFEVTYVTNAAPWFTISTPVDNLSHPFTNWVAGTTLEDFAQSGFVTSTNPAILAGTGHQLIAHYTFDDSSSIFNLGLDSSTNGNNLESYSWWGPLHTNTTDAVAGGGAVQFFGASCITAINQTLTNLNDVLTGSFTFSGWVKTTASQGGDSDDAVSGASIFWAYNDHSGTNDAIPLAITGSKAAFSARDHLGDSFTVHSLSSVNDGNYHLITVTRDQNSGQMKMYVDGNFEASTFGTTDPLNGNNYFISIGGTVISSYTGILDDVQVYSGVLSAAEVTGIYTNPGVTIPDVAAGAANGLVAHYDFDEGNVVAPDVSGNGNNLVLADNFGGAGPVISTNAIAGAGSVYFDGGSFLTAPSNLLATLAANFTISLWVNTTQYYDNPGDYAYDGAGVISADVPGIANDLVPVALTGGQVAFNIGNTQYGYDDTINSSATVNDGLWHHVVVCRNQATGEKDIYIDGVLDTSDFDTTALLNDPQLLTIGAIADASNPDPDSPSYTGNNGYQGFLDDIQIYDRVLGSNEVAFLYNNPGATVGSPVTAPAPYPVDANLQFTFIRSQDPNLGEYYSASVSFNSISPAATTTNRVQSPNS